MKYENLLEPVKIQDLELKNRVVFNALVTKMVEDSGEVTEELINFHVGRAKGGVGLNIVEIASVHEDSALEGYLSIASDDFVPKLQELTDGVHEVGGKIGIQLWQPGMASYIDDKEVIVPTEFELPNGDKVEAATVDQIEEVVDSFGKAAKRAVEAGFDTVEIHAGLNDSLHMFLSNGFNEREDDYGGSIENRSRFLVEVVREVRKNIPENMPLFLRLVSQDDYIPGGLEIEDIIEISNLVKEEGVDVLNITRGNITTPAVKYVMAPIEVERGFNVENTDKIREGTGMLTVAAGRINDPKYANEILEKGKADLIGMNRALLVDPDFLLKIKEDRVEDIIKCIGCNQGCYDIFIDQDDIILQEDKNKISCMLNPGIGREDEYQITKTEDPQKVAIVGGGIGGIHAAILLHQRGHEPVLFEETDRLGGQFILAGEIIGKEEIKEGILYQIDQLERTGLEIRLNTKFETDMINEENYDSVIIATGAVGAMPSEVEGTDSEGLIQGKDLLAENMELEGDIIIVGGGFAGLTVAEKLALSENTKVTIIEKEEKVGKDLIEIRRDAILESLEEAGSEIITEALCVELTDDTVTYEDADEKKHKVSGDYVIITTGSESVKSNYIKQYCQDREMPFYVIGDALIPRKAEDAIAEAYNIALFEIE